MATNETAALAVMIEMAEKAGTLWAELKIARATLNSLQASTDPEWVRKQIAEVVARIERVTEETR